MLSPLVQALICPGVEIIDLNTLKKKKSPEIILKLLIILLQSFWYGLKGFQLVISASVSLASSEQFLA